MKFKGDYKKYFKVEFKGENSSPHLLKIQKLFPAYLSLTLMRVKLVKNLKEFIAK